MLTETEDISCISDMTAIASEWTKNSIQVLGATRISLHNALPDMKWGWDVHEYLEMRNFSFVSQGIYDREGKLIKTELLARFRGLDGTLSPGVFIPVINAIGHKTIFDYLVIEKAFAEIARVRPTVPCSINVNPSTFENDAYFIAYIDRLQKLHNIDPTRIILEILETEPTRDPMSFNKILGKLRRKWYKIAVDDFHPVGNHNLVCIDHLYEIDTVKFDGVYMCDLYAHRDEQSVTAELLEMLYNIRAKHPHIDIVVEKIESPEMFQFFSELFIDFGIEDIHFQGYYFDQGSEIAHIHIPSPSPRKSEVH